MKILESKVSFHYSCSFHSSPENILLSWNVAGLCYPVQVIQVTKGKNKHCFQLFIKQQQNNYKQLRKF